MKEIALAVSIAIIASTLVSGCQGQSETPDPSKPAIPTEPQKTPPQTRYSPDTAAKAPLRTGRLSFALTETRSQAVTISLDATQLGYQAEKEGGGISFHRLTSGEAEIPYKRNGDLNLSRRQIAAIRDLRLPMSRIYAIGDTTYGADKLGYGLTQAIDKVKKLVDLLGIPEESFVLEFEDYSPEEPFPVEDWVRGVRHSIDRGYKFRYWEISNEPYTRHARNAYPDAKAYQDHFRNVTTALRRVHPEGQFGLAITRDQHRSKWREEAIANLAGYYDFVVAHHYNFGENHRLKFHESVLNENYHDLNQVLEINTLLKRYNPGRTVYQYDTEWGNHSRGPRQRLQAESQLGNAAILGVLHRITRMIFYARGGYVEGASSWAMFGRDPAKMGFGVLPDYNDRELTMLYHTYYYMNRHVGDYNLVLRGSTPYVRSGEKKLRSHPGPATPVLATISDDGNTIYLVIVNGFETRQLPCTIEIANFTSSTVRAVQLGAALNANPVLKNKNEFVTERALSLRQGEMDFTLAAGAAIFITLERD